MHLLIGWTDIELCLMVRKVLRKIFSPWSKNSSERLQQTRDQQHEKAEELTPGHHDRATQIGVFH
jgi:hypothetical protein